MSEKRRSVKIPKSVLGRASKLLGSGASILGREVAGRISGSQDLALRVNQAKDLVAALSQLKGAAMKVGQLISLELSDVLPDEVIQVLRKLHDDSTVMEFKEIDRILRQELGEKYHDLVDLSPEPLASASIGQVHTAKLQGRQVALKIQFPGVANSIDSDVKLLKRIIDSFLTVKGTQASFDGVIDEVRDSLHLEVDYRKEADALIQYREIFHKIDGYIVPEVYRDHSTSSVLTLSYEEGLRIQEFLDSSPSAEERDAFGDKVLRLLLMEFFEIGLVQTDPNYGNFLVADDGQIVLLDFGATKTYSPDFRDKVREVLKLALELKKEELIEAAIAFDLLDKRESPEIQEMFCELMETVTYMFRPDVQPFNFADTDYLSEIREVTMKFANSVKYTAPARHMIFLNRKLGGMYHLLKDVEYKKDLVPFWDQVMNMELRQVI